MSVLQNPIVGRMKQKIGGVVMTTWKGINVMKGKPLTVANPKTDPQLMRRSALTQIVAIARIIVAAIGFGFKEQAVRKSAFNAFTGYNLRNAFNYAAPPAATLVPADVLVSQGTIAPTPIDSLSASAAAREIVMNYFNLATLPGQSISDLAYAVIYNATQDKWGVADTAGADRNGGTAVGTMPTGFFAIGDNLRVYLFFYNPTQRKSSDSITGTVVAGA